MAKRAGTFYDMAAARNSTLIGIGIVIVVVAVVALLAVPAWRNHTVRIHVTAALKAADGAKLVVMEAATTRGGLDHLDVADLAYNGNTTDPYVAGVAINAAGHITVTTRNTGASHDPVLELVPGEAASAQGPAPIMWTCLVVGGDADAAPEDCHAASGKSPSAASAPAQAGSATR